MRETAPARLALAQRFLGSEVIGHVGVGTHQASAGEHAGAGLQVATLRRAPQVHLRRLGVVGLAADERAQVFP